MSNIIITGPTGVGKSVIALELAQKLGAIIINCDSKQIYKQLPIITAQPSKEDLQKCQHELYGYIDINQHRSVATWSQDIKRTINTYQERQKIIVGGTGMYINTLIKGLTQLPEISASTKKTVEEKMKKQTLQQLYEELYHLDSNSMKKINKNDSYRIKKMLEIYSETKQTYTQIVSKNNNIPIISDYKIFIVNIPRDELYSNINERVINMLSKGLIEEINDIKNYNITHQNTSFASIGIKEAIDYINKKISKEDMIDKIQTLTRRYAKKQLTWFRHQLPNAITISNLQDIEKELII